MTTQRRHQRSRPKIPTDNHNHNHNGYYSVTADSHERSNAYYGGATAATTSSSISGTNLNLSTTRRRHNIPAHVNKQSTSALISPSRRSKNYHGHSHGHNHNRNNRIHNSPRNRVHGDDASVEPTFAALRLTLSDLFRILVGYITRGLQKIRRTGPKILRNILLIVGILVILFMSMMMVLVIRFVQNEVRPLCSKPDIEVGLGINANLVKDPSMSASLKNGMGDTGVDSSVESGGSSMNKIPQSTPLVEYYVHGRGNGHYARSVAIVEQLLNKGVDVRMFIGRATMWRAVHEARREHSDGNGNNHHFQGDESEVSDAGASTETTSEGEEDTESDESIKKSHQRRGEVTVTSIPSLLPTMGFWDTISLMIERVLNDCTIAKTTKRYPDLVISDGDLPGMLRAKYGSLPSVSVAHGQTFVIGQKPEWVKKDETLNRAWRKQARLNGMASWYSDWLIGTNFVDIPVQEGNGVVARSPMRPEVIRMGRERQRRTRQSLLNHRNHQVLLDSDGGVDVLRVDGGSGVHIEDTFMTSWQKDTIDDLLVGSDITSSLRVTRNAVETKQMNPLSDEDLKLTRRKIVICYFRDKNGDLLTKTLLRSGFDVVLFERGFHKGLSDLDEKKFGQDLIVHRDRRVYHGGSGESSSTENTLSLMEYWSSILRRYDRRLLVDDDELSDKDLVGMSKDEEADQDDPYAPKEEASIELRHALNNLHTLFKSRGASAPRIIRVTDMSLFVPLLSIADGVASSAGSQLISECIYSHLNVLALHREDDDEQMLNIAFSKHRHDRLSKDKQGGNEKMGHYANENVVHGMSLEKFEKLLEIIAMHDDNNKSKGNSNADSKNEFDMFLSESEQAILLRTEDEKQIYAEFKTFVESVKSSPISWSYYHDLFHGIVDSTSGSSKVDSGITFGEKKEDKKKNSNAPSSPNGGDDEKYIDPFQGMPEVARVILEILDDLTKNKQ